MVEISRNEACSHCGRFANRGVSVDAVVINGGKILLIKRGAEPFKGYWGTPGGFVEWDESTEDAAKRELQEETGLVAADVKLVGVYSSPDRHPRQVINAAYLVRVEDVSLVMASDDADDAQWFALDDLPKELAFDHRQIIQDARGLA
jgi:8-oxo-dGTP diphosphatase